LIEPLTVAPPEGVVTLTVGSVISALVGAVF
jgi:hypothetical protein